MKVLDDYQNMLKEKIVLCTDFTPDERDLLLDVLNLQERPNKHKYPKQFGPGSSPFTTVAWGILDQLNPDAMTLSNRYMLAGMLAAAFSEMYELGRTSK